MASLGFFLGRYPGKFTKKSVLTIPRKKKPTILILLQDIPIVSSLRELLSKVPRESNWAAARGCPGGRDGGAADERGSGQAYWRALAVSSALPCACMHARACACSARARHALHARTFEKLNGGWPGGRDGGGRARLPQTAARCAAERWPCHLRCHARACTRARSARMRAREKSIGMAPDEHGCSGQACGRALDTSSAL